MGTAEIRSKPLGCVVVLTPWNFPVHIPVSALGDVLGAGNRAVLKPSEVTPRAAALMAELFKSSWLGTEGVVEVCCGGPEVANALASSPYADHVLFVGSGEIGRKVLAAAAPNLTKCTLELGGGTRCSCVPMWT